ncbi:hypothetical protein GC177_07185 [bacterium]|nr:hypothetical protein [bacterium]
MNAKVTQTRRKQPKAASAKPARPHPFDAMAELVESSPQALAWVWTGVTALAIGGVFSILLVLCRTPGVQEAMPFKDFFHTALVAHVDLTVLAWFMSVACLWWHLLSQGRMLIVQRFAQGCFMTGVLLMAIAPFASRDAGPLMNNYVPVLQEPVFFLVLGFWFAALLLQSVSTLFAIHIGRHSGLMTLLGWASALITFTSLMALVLSYNLMPAGLAPEEYFEKLFWAGGHLLQINHTHVLLLCWMALCMALGWNVQWEQKWAMPLIVLVTASVPLSLLPFGIWPVNMPGFQLYYTGHMMVAGALYLLPFVLLLLRWRGKHRETVKAGLIPIRNSLYASIMLFAAGGFIATMIREVDVTIPAHYHGSIVGISIACMGLFYALLPLLGKSPVTGRAGRWQPWIYGIGQLMHISGLFISGGYEVARKTTESYQAMGAKIGMGIMGLGGTVAIVGGLMFVWLMITHLRRPKTIL